MKLNLSFLILLIIAIISCICDFTSYVFQLPFIISFVLSLTMTLLLIFKFRKKIIVKSNVEFLDIFFFAIIILSAISTLPIPDVSPDTANYHIYLQENIGFIDKINFDFFVGRIVNCFSYSLGDRMNYIFRFFLGYRLGTILSFYSVIVLFYQFKRILKITMGDFKLTPIVALLCYFSDILC